MLASIGDGIDMDMESPVMLPSLRLSSSLDSMGEIAVFSSTFCFRVSKYVPISRNFSKVASTFGGNCGRIVLFVAREKKGFSSFLGILQTSGLLSLIST